MRSTAQHVEQQTTQWEHHKAQCERQYSAFMQKPGSWVTHHFSGLPPSPPPPPPPTHTHKHKHDPPPRHAPTGEVLEEHPLDSYFRELLRRRRRELMRRKKAALKAVNAIAAFGWKRSSTAAAGGSTAPPQAPPQQQPPQPPGGCELFASLFLRRGTAESMCLLSHLHWDTPDPLLSPHP
jgi:hypothetical protein